MIRRAGVMLAATAVLLCYGAPVRAQTQGATGFVASGTIVVQAAFSGTPVTLGGPIAVERRNALYRFQLQSLQLPGMDATISAALGSVLNQGGATVVYDGATGTLRAWASGNGTYYLAEKPAAARPAREPTTAAPSDPLAFLGALTHASRGLQSASVGIDLTGHGMVNGHPASMMNVDVRRTPVGGSAEEVRGAFAFADDLDGIPLQAALQGISGSLAGYAAKLDLTSVAATVPDSADFTPPSGYRRVQSLTEILRPSGF